MTRPRLTRRELDRILSDARRDRAVSALRALTPAQAAHLVTDPDSPLLVLVAAHLLGGRPDAGAIKQALSIKEVQERIAEVLGTVFPDGPPDL